MLVRVWRAVRFGDHEITRPVHENNHPDGIEEEAFPQGLKPG